LLVRRCSWVFLPCPSQVCSRGWVSAVHFWCSGPRVASHANKSAPIYFRRGDRAPEWKAPFKGRSAGDSFVALDFWALTPICDPHPPADSRETDPALGFASCRVCRARVCAIERTRLRSNHRPPEREQPASSVAFRASQSAHGFCGEKLAVPFSVLMGPMPGLA
jgi:hypothetical protein